MLWKRLRQWGIGVVSECSSISRQLHRGAEEMCTGTINDQHANYRRTASGPDPTPRVCGLDPGQVLGLDVSCCVLFQLGF